MNDIRIFVWEITSRKSRVTESKNVIVEALREVFSRDWKNVDRNDKILLVYLLCTLEGNEHTTFEYNEMIVCPTI